MKIVEPKQSKNAKEITKKRYLMSDSQDRPVETVGEMLWRVAQHMAKPEVLWEGNGMVQKTAEKFYERMVKKKFVCSGKAMFEAGNLGTSGQLAACFVLPIEDSIDSIFKTLGEAAVVHKNNGGTGFNFSAIRPHGDRVKNVMGAASGPVDFIRAFSAALSKILQGAKRQGANIAILNIDHPDIEEFIEMKDEDGNLKNFNVSVGVTDEFMKAVKKKSQWRLVHPRTKEVVKKIRADILFDKICEHAHLSGDPGMMFLDAMERDNPTPTLGKIEATNPCGEIAMLPYENCNLTSISLAEHLKKNDKGEYEIDWKDLEKSVRVGVRFLDNMVEVNNYPLPQNEKMVKDGNRRIGLGVMGFAHLLYKLEIGYNSEKAVVLSEKLASFIRKEADKESERLAVIRGNFSNYDVSIYKDSKAPRRNCATTMIAPTGTISMFADCSSGIEPVFSLVTLRRTFFEDNKENRPTRELTITDPVFEEYLKTWVKDKKRRQEILEQVASEGGIRNVKELPLKIRRVFCTTHQIEPEYHVRIQAAWQKHFDNSVSKTVNFNHKAKVSDVKNAYFLAWKLKCKGITIYRDGSKEDQVLRGSEKGSEFEFPVKFRNLKSEVCVDCGGGLEIKEGCFTCSQCGWSKCSI
jgi:ribonucleoside-diphosphate reductase alpha chain